MLNICVTINFILTLTNYQIHLLCFFSQTADELCYSIEVTSGKINVYDLLKV